PITEQRSSQRPRPAPLEVRSTRSTPRPRWWTPERDRILVELPPKDAVVQLGISRHAVNWRRARLSQLGVKVYPVRRGRPPLAWNPPWPAEVVHRLGKEPDAHIAHDLGVATA